jgi:diguanylate cyclase (GGDEF)-like protein
MPQDRVNVLLVEDNPGDTRLIREMLAGPAYFGNTYHLSHVDNLASALQTCQDHADAHELDVVLLDLNLPDSTGLQALQSLNEMIPQIPIIILTGLNDAELTAQSVQQGAQDYITKEECSSQLLTRVIHYAMERKRIETQLKHLATHDALTGLPNRALFYDRLSLAMKRTIRKNTGGLNWKAAVMLMDLDNFKQVNDNFGHESGDKVLRHLAPRLRMGLRQSDTVARLGGDEFAFVLEGIHDPADCLFVTQKILRSFQRPIVLNGSPYQLSASIGVSIFPDDSDEIDRLVKYADQAMYLAKRQTGHVRFHQDADE